MLSAYYQGLNPIALVSSGLAPFFSLAGANLVLPVHGGQLISPCNLQESLMLRAQNHAHDIACSESQAPSSRIAPGHRMGWAIQDSTSPKCNRQNLCANHIYIYIFAYTHLLQQMQAEADAC